jgi:type IV pilus assembly protein PilE
MLQSGGNMVSPTQPEQSASNGRRSPGAPTCSHRTNGFCRRAGFSLIELIVAVAIVAILAGIAYPSYTSHVTATRRGVDGQGAVLLMSKQLEKFYTGCGSYTITVVSAPGSLNNCTGLEMATDFSPERHYRLNIVPSLNGAGVMVGYTINAVPQGAQAARDTDCGTLTYTNANVKGQTGPAPGSVCWKR